jgi:hypothetical protein
VYGTTSVDSAVACFNAAVQDAMEQAIPYGILNSNSKYPHCYCSSLRYYIRKKNYFYRLLKKINLTAFTKNAHSVISWLRLILSLRDLDGLNLWIKIYGHTPSNSGSMWPLLRK